MDPQLIYITLAVILALTFQPLRRFLEKATDRIFFRDRYDSQTVLNQIGSILTSERLLERLLHDCLSEICRNLKINSGLFIIFMEDDARCVSHYGTHLGPAQIDESQLHKLGNQLAVSDRLEPDDAHLEVMQALKIRVSVPLKIRGKLVGYLLLGDKRSGSVYSRQDIGLLEVAAPSVAIAVSNAQAYDKITRFNATLQKEIRQATHSLRVANRNLKALDKTKDEFLSIASHQLRTPLATIEGYLSMMAHGDVGEVPPKQAHFLESASEATKRMAAIVTEILDISSLTAGRFVAQKEAVDLAAMAETETRNLSTMAEAAGLKLTYQGPGRPLPLLQLDENKTHQIIMNLIDNAIHYTPEGTIHVVLKEVDGNVRLTVTDTGIGIPPSEQIKLFSKFFRGNNARQLRPDGSGLGLYLTKQVIEAEGGKVIFSSREGQGSTFGFEIPLPVVAAQSGEPVTADSAVYAARNHK